MYLAGVMLSCLPVAVQAVVRCRGHMRMSLVVAVQMLWDIARCMLTAHHNAGICMSGVVSHLCTIHGCTIVGSCTVGYVKISPAMAVQTLWDIARCMLTVHHNAGICMSGVVSHLCTVHGCTITGGCVGSCTVGYVKILPAVAVQMRWDIARCILMVVHRNAGICMSGVVSHLCTVHGCTIAGGCAGSEGDCVGDVCGCVSAGGVCRWW